MHEVKLDKDRLIAVVKKNRNNHRDVFEEAIIGYRKNVTERLEAMIKDLKACKTVDSYVRIPAPIDQTYQYDRVLAMLEMSVEDVITLTEHEFSCYVMDRWDWKREFATTNKAYLSSNNSLAYVEDAERY